ncbi:hypothetical protein PBCV1_a200aR [Paramecium bursaria Chlorella virus 1]|uniref:Uncharacterized protein n=1 Tax=Paramecium bursaria Chlorella virus 1 TaxID=10506 RepID=F8TTZ4_PBCV1|nr:hypothetical protein PBCV1_a200aR [Paramecium bursaria Chlorella virus 1]AEI70055.1 hypothetical protein [Paramecium bursaria Chlorella virus 1]
MCYMYGCSSAARSKNYCILDSVWKAKYGKDMTYLSLLRCWWYQFCPPETESNCK